MRFGVGEFMAQKAKRYEEFITLTVEARGVITYADYFTRKPLFSSLQIKNDGADSVEGLTLTVEGENGLIVPTVKTIAEIPFESAVGSIGITYPGRYVLVPRAKASWSITPPRLT